MDWTWETVAGPYNATTEGPAWTGHSLLFSCIPKNQVLHYDPATNQVTEFRKHTNRINGLAFAPDGALYACQSASRRIVRLNQDGSTTPLPYLLDGRYHNQPNDLVVDSQGRLWFSDPYEYGQDTPSRGPRPKPAVTFGAILRLDPASTDGRPPPRSASAVSTTGISPTPAGAGTHDVAAAPLGAAATGIFPRGEGWALRRITHDTLNPNGLALSPDERTLYVAETSLKGRGVRELRAYPINDDATVGPYRVLHDFGNGDRNGRARGVDGMTVDAEGNILACAGHHEAGPGPMVYVFSPTGRILATHPVPANKPTNITWGGPDLTELYVTTIPGHLYRIRNTGHKGHLQWLKPAMLH